MVVILRRPRSKLANTLMVQTITKVKSFPSSWRRSQWSFQASSSSAVNYLTRRPIVSVVIINWPAEFSWLESCHQKRRFALFPHQRLFIPSVKSSIWIIVTSLFLSLSSSFSLSKLTRLFSPSWFDFSFSPSSNRRSFFSLKSGTQSTLEFSLSLSLSR